MRAVSSGTGGTGCCRRSDMDDPQTRDPSNARALHKAADFANGVRSYTDALWSAVQKVALWGFEQGLSFGQSFWTGPQAPSAQQSPRRTGLYEVDQFTSKKILAGPSPPAPARIAPDRDDDEASRKRR